MRKSVFEKTLEEDILRINEVLGFTDKDLSSLIGMPEDRIKYLKPKKTFSNREDQHSEEDKKDMDFISHLEGTILDFKRHHMTSEDILEVLSKKVNGKTVLELHKHKYDYGSSEYKDIHSFIPEICFTSFELYEIGEKASFNQKLNRKISEQYYGRKVAIKEETIYQDHGGDYEILQAKELLEVYSDGSGEHWEKLKDYSTDISEAWKLVEELATKGVQIRLSNKAMHNQYWWCYLSAEPESNKPDVCAQGNTAAEAICLAILDYVNKKS